MTGLDKSARFIELARSRAAEQGLSVEYLEGDLRELPFEGRFDALTNWFSSFGYFVEQASRELLMSNLPRHGGPALIMTERGDDLMIDRVTFDLGAGRSHTDRITVRGGPVSRTQFSLSASQLTDWLHEAGFATVEARDETGEPVRPQSRRLVVRALVG